MGVPTRRSASPPGGPAAARRRAQHLAWLLVLLLLGVIVVFGLERARRGTIRKPVPGGAGGSAAGAAAAATVFGRLASAPAEGQQPQRRFLMFFSGHQGSSALDDMLAAHPAVFTPGFEPLDMPGLTPEHKLAFLQATFAWPRASDGPVAWRAWRAALTPPVSGLRVDRKELVTKAVASKSVAGFKMRPYGGPSAVKPGSGGGGGRGAPLGSGSGTHTAMAGLDPAAVRDLLHRFNVSVLLTLRHNSLKEALSWYKARELNISQFTTLRAAQAVGGGSSEAVGGVADNLGSGGDSSSTSAASTAAAQHAVHTPASSPYRVTIDIPRLMSWLSYTTRVNSYLLEAVSFFNRPTLTVWYEDFERDALAEATRAAEFVGVPLEGSGLELSARFRKAGPDAIQDWVENYEELCRALEGGPYYQHLDAAACPSAVRTTGGASTNAAAPQPASVQPALSLHPSTLLGNWCLPVDKQASGWAALSDTACMQRAAAAQEAAAADVRAGRGTLIFKHVHKAGGSTLCRLALQNMRAESPKLPGRSDWDTNCVPFEAFLGPHPAVGSGARSLAAAALPAAARARRPLAGALLGRRLQANYLGGACWLGFLTPPQLRSLPRHYAPLTFVASEGPLPDAVPLDTPGLAWVTMLRRPADRVLSSFRWWQLMAQRWPQSPAECHAYSAPANATLEEWLEAFPTNWMTRELVGRSALYDRRPLTTADLRAAQARLHLFAAVLVLERPESSMALLRDRFGWVETGWAEHRAGSAVDSDATAELPPVLVARLRQHTELDEELYAYAVALHEAQARAGLRAAAAA